MVRFFDESTRGDENMVAIGVSISILFSSQFVKTYGTYPFYEFINSAILTQDKGFILVGSQGYDIFDVLIAKFDSVGNFKWCKKMGGDLLNHEASCIISTSDGNFAIAGYIDNDKPFIGKFDSLGNFLWVKGVEGNGYISLYSLIQCHDKGFLLAGNISGVGPTADILLLKFDSTGNFIWGKLINAEDDDGVYSLIETENKKILALGFTYNGIDSDILISKFDSAGNLIWAKTIGEGGYEGGYSLIEFQNGHFIISGITTSFSSSSDIILINIDSLGNLIWSKVIGGNGKEYLGFKSLIKTQDDGFGIAATTESFGNTPDIFFTKFDSAGNLEYAKKFNLNTFYPFYDYGKVLIQTPGGEYVIVGEIEDTTLSSRPVDIIGIGFDSLGNTCQGDSVISPFLFSVYPQIMDLSVEINPISFSLFSPSCSLYSDYLGQSNICEVKIEESFCKCFCKCKGSKKIFSSSLIFTKNLNSDSLFSSFFPLKIILYNSSGSLIFEKKKNSEFFMNKEMQKLSPGVYFLSIYFRDKVKKIKIINQP